MIGHTDRGLICDWLNRRRADCNVLKLIKTIKLRVKKRQKTIAESDSG